MRRVTFRVPLRNQNKADQPKPGSEEIVGLTHVSEETIYPHVFPNSDREVGGVLVGRAAADGTLPLITGAIPAISADERRATLTFTQDAWEHVHRTLDSRFPPDEQIVGWYHSHPGFGIFLSGHDLFIHHNFFSGPSQIAVVVDPVAQVEGAFIWREQQVMELFERPTPPRWIAEGTWRPPPAPSGAQAQRSGVPNPRQPYPLLPLVIAGMLGIGLGYGGWSLAADGGSAQKASSKTTTTERRSSARDLNRRSQRSATQSTPTPNSASR